MWPWGHLAVGYVLYSLSARLLAGRPPGDRAAILLVAGTQLPDLVDKPLAWVFGLTPGYAVGHAALVAVPVGLVLALAAALRDRPEGLAFAVGWWSHLAGDVLVAAAAGNPYALGRVLWPVVTVPSDGVSLPAAAHVAYYLEAWLADLTAWFLLGYVGALGAAFGLWLADGAPGVPKPWRDARTVDAGPD